MKYYKGKYKCKNPLKYMADTTNIVYRSHWERQFMRWLDQNSDVKKWGSECLIIPYICETDNRKHRYFVDFVVEFKNGKRYCIEIKPEAQTKQPKSKRGKPKKKLLEEYKTYSKNQSKWKAADKYCKKRGWEFKVFTENTLKSIGIKLLT